MTAQFAQSEGERVQANLIRIGVVTAVDPVNALATMNFAGLESDWLPWGVARAGGTRTASAPTVGEQRLVFSPYGDTSQAVIGQALYQDAHPAPSTSADDDGTEFPDGTRVFYNSATNTLQIDVAGDAKVIVNCKQATVKATTSVTLDTPTVHATGSLQVDGNVTANGDVNAGAISLKLHHHTAQGATAPTTAAQA